MSDHVWTQENIAAYVAGGFDASEAERLEKHVADCPACARLVDEARSLEKKLAPLVSLADPGPSLEDRIIQALPSAQAAPTMRSWLASTKTLLAVAAAVLLAALGAGLRSVMEPSGHLSMTGFKSEWVMALVREKDVNATKYYKRGRILTPRQTTGLCQAPMNKRRKCGKRRSLPCKTW